MAISMPACCCHLSFINLRRRQVVLDAPEVLMIIRLDARSTITIWNNQYHLQVVDAPEVLTIIDSMPDVATFLNALYSCQYSDFFKVHGSPASGP